MFWLITAYTEKTGFIQNHFTPSEKKIPFSVPVLSIRQGDLFEQFEETHFLDHSWKLTNCDALLSEEEYPTKRPDTQVGEIDIAEDGKVAARFVSNLQAQMKMFAADKPDLMLLDLIMPVKNGFEVLEEINGAGLTLEEKGLVLAGNAARVLGR